MTDKVNEVERTIIMASLKCLEQLAEENKGVLRELCKIPECGWMHGTCFTSEHIFIDTEFDKYDCKLSDFLERVLK